MSTVTIEDYKKWECKAKENYIFLKKKIIEEIEYYRHEDDLEGAACKQGILYGYIEAYKNLGLIKDEDYDKLYDLIL